MIPSDVSPGGIYDLFSSASSPDNLSFQNPSSVAAFPGNNNDLSLFQNSIQFQFSKFLNNNSNFPESVGIPPPPPDYSIPTSCVSNNSTTSDEADDQNYYHQLADHHVVIDERRQRRMISNRESARRSRMRKQRHLDELLSQVFRLRTENSGLLERLNQVSESHERVVQENARLKAEASELKTMLSDLQLNCSYNSLKDLDDVSCNTAHLRAESSSNQSTTTKLY